MKRFYILFFALFTITTTSYSQVKKDDNSIVFNVDAGYGTKGFVPISFGLIRNSVYYGISLNYNVDTGTNGKKYKKIGWDELPGDHVSEGSYQNSALLDMGYVCFHNVVIVIGGGYTFTRDYRNCYDETHVLGDDGYYWKNKSVTGDFDCHTYFNYYFGFEKSRTMYLKAGFGRLEGAFACLGLRF